jgi:hypothetical protein
MKKERKPRASFFPYLSINEETLAIALRLYISFTFNSNPVRLITSMKGLDSSVAEML